MPFLRILIHATGPPRFGVFLVMAAILSGCGKPGPSPVPAGQIGPGEPDASGIPSPPSKGGV